MCLKDAHFQKIWRFFHTCPSFKKMFTISNHVHVFIKKLVFPENVCEFYKIFPSIFCYRFSKSVNSFQKTIQDLKNCSSFLECSETIYLKIPSIERIERKSRLNNSWAFSRIGWSNKTLKCPRSMNQKNSGLIPSHAMKPKS